MNKIAGGAAPQGPLAAAIVAAMADTILILDPMGRIMFLSTSNDDVLGQEPDHWIGQSAIDLVHRDDQHIVISRLRAAIDRPEAPRRFVQVRIGTGTDPWLPVEAHGFNPIEFEGVTCVLVSVRDATGHLSFERARQVAGRTIDTSFADASDNRQMIIDRLLPDMLRGTRAADQLLVICLSVVNYQELVDEFGTEASVLMTELAHGVNARSRVDDLVARLSEHQLLIACPSVETTRQANELAQRMRLAAESISEDLAPFIVRHGFALTSHGDVLGEVLDFAAA